MVELLRQEHSFYCSSNFDTVFPKYAKTLHEHHIESAFLTFEVRNFHDTESYSTVVSILLKKENRDEYFGLYYQSHDYLHESNIEYGIIYALEEAILNIKNGIKS